MIPGAAATVGSIIGGAVTSRMGSPAIGAGIGGTIGQAFGTFGEELIEGKAQSTFGGGSAYSGNPSNNSTMFGTSLSRMTM